MQFLIEIDKEVIYKMHAVHMLVNWCICTVNEKMYNYKLAKN